MKAIFVVLLSIIGLTLSNLASAAPTVCSTNHGGYCQYTGKVKQIYVNSAGIIIMYFDSTFDVSTAHDAGFPQITINNAAAIQIADNPEFAKLFYSTALAAQSTGRSVTVQMRNNVSGYLKLDRIWLAEK